MKIITIDETDPVLLEILLNKTKKVPVDKIPSYSDLVEEMIRTAQKVNAVGLAANQVGLPVSLFVCLETYEPSKSTHSWFAAFNPVVVASQSKWTTYGEACLSHPDRAYNVRRPKQLTIRYYDLSGKTVLKKSKNKYEAGAWQHEIDHLNGILLKNKGKLVHHA